MLITTIKELFLAVLFALPAVTADTGGYMVEVTAEEAEIKDKLETLMTLPRGTRLWLFELKGKDWALVKAPESEKRGWILQQQLEQPHYNAKKIKEIDRLTRLSQGQMLQKQWDSAAKTAKKRLNAIIQVFGKDDMSTADGHGLVARAIGTDDAEQARYHHQQAIDIANKFVGTHHPITSALVNNFALFEKRSKNYRPAMKLYEQALAMDIKRAGENSDEAASTLNNMGMLALAMGQHQEAVDTLTRALNIRTRTAGRDHSLTQTTRDNLTDARVALRTAERRANFRPGGEGAFVASVASSAVLTASPKTDSVAELATVVSEVTDASASFSKGDKLQILWKDKWWDGEVLEKTDKNSWKIHYSGFANTWDEVVGPGRIRKPQELQHSAASRKTRVATANPGFSFKRSSGERVETNQLAFSPDGRYLAIGEYNVNRPSFLASAARTVNMRTSRNKQAITRLVDTSTGREVRRLIGHPGVIEILSISFSPDSKFVVTTGFNSLATMRSYGMPGRDVEQAKIWSVTTGEELFFLPNVKYATFSPDGKSLATYGSGSIAVRNVTDLVSRKELPVLWSVKANGSPSAAPIFSADSTRLYITSSKGVHAFNFASGDLIYTKETSGQCTLLASSPDGKVLAAASKGILYLWDAERGTELRRIDSNEPIRELFFASNSEEIVAVDRSGVARWWEIQTGEVRLSRSNVGPIMAPSPSGMIAAVDRKSDGFVELVDLATGSATTQIHQFDEPRTFLTESNTGVYVAGDQNNNASVDGAIHSPEELVLAFDAMSFSRPKNRDKQSATSAARPTRRMYVLSVGVSKYKYPEYNLELAAKDATDVSDFFLSQDEVLYDVVVQRYIDENATRDNVQRGLEWLKNSCGKEDIAVVMFAGHAIQGRNGLYFMTHEGDSESIQNTCVNWTNVASLVSKLSAKNILIFADCCHAGDFATRRRPTQDAVAQAFASKPGLFLFCSSKGDQLSLEDSNLNNGLFTYELIAGLQGSADTNSDSQVTTEELRTYVVAAVESRTDGEQTPDTPLQSNSDWGLALAKHAKQGLTTTDIAPKSNDPSLLMPVAPRDDATDEKDTPAGPPATVLPATPNDSPTIPTIESNAKESSVDEPAKAARLVAIASASR